MLYVSATAPGQVEELFGKRKSSIRRSARATLGRNHNDSKGMFGERHLDNNTVRSKPCSHVTFTSALERQNVSDDVDFDFHTHHLHYVSITNNIKGRKPSNTHT